MTKQLEKLVVTLEAKTASYEAKLKKATDEASRWASRAKQATDSATESFSSLGGKMNKFEGSMGNTTKAFRVQKNAIQGVSFQLQDVAVQAQAGTSAFTILGQQGSQIASLFGPGGAVLGAIIAVSAGLGGVLTKAMGEVNDEVDTLEKTVDRVIGRTYRARLREVNAAVEGQTEKVQKLKAEFERVDALISKPINPQGASYIYGSAEERQAIRENLAQKRIELRITAMDQLADAQAQLNLLLEKQSDLEAEMRKPETDAQDAIKKQKLKEAQERLQLEESVMGQVNKIRYEKYNPVQREQKIHEDRMALFRQYEELKLGTQSEYNALAEQEDARHKQALQEAQMQHYLSQATAFENLLMQYHEAAENSAAILSETLVGAVDNFITSFSHAMASAIVQGDSLSDALKGVGQAMLTHVLGALIKMGAQMLINSLFSKQIQAIQVAAAKISGTAIATAYAPAAAMVSLASFGSNAAPAAAGISSTVALAHTEALTGMAHDGISEVPREGTWLLDKGERVLSAQQNADFSQFMQQMNSGGTYTGGGATNISIHMEDDSFFSSNALRRLWERMNEEVGDKLNVRVITV